MQVFIHILLLGALFVLLQRLKCDAISKRFISFYMIFWAFGIILSNNAALYEVSSYAYFLIYLHLVFFIIGFFIIKFTNKSTTGFQLSRVSIQIDRLVNSRMFNIILIICLVYVIYLFVKFYSLIILYQSLAAVRDDFFDADINIYGPYFDLMNTLLLLPLFYTLIPVFAYKCLFKRDIKTLFYAAYLLVYASLGGARFDYIRIALGFVFILFCIYNDYIKKKTKIIITVGGGAVIAVLLVFITMGRTGVISTDKEDFDEGLELTSKQVASYSGGSIVAFDISLNNDYKTRIHGPKYGRLTLSAIDVPLCAILRKVGFSVNDATGELTKIKQDETIQTGPEIRHNALYTSLLFYYQDLGFWGCLLFPFLFGLLSRKLIISLYKRQDLASFLLLYILFSCLFYSIYDFAMTYMALFLFSAVLLILRKKRFYI